MSFSISHPATIAKCTPACKSVCTPNREKDGERQEAVGRERSIKVSVRTCIYSSDNRNRALPETEDIKKRWQEYTQELYKKDFQDPDNHDGVITHLETGILECEVKWALGTSLWKKLVEVMEFQLSYFIS